MTGATTSLNYLVNGRNVFTKISIDECSGRYFTIALKRTHVTGSPRTRDYYFICDLVLMRKITTNNGKNASEHGGDD
jgi:hypothetical protein